MRLFVPAVGDDLVLSQDWLFHVYSEKRNNAFLTEYLEHPESPYDLKIHSHKSSTSIIDENGKRFYQDLVVYGWFAKDKGVNGIQVFCDDLKLDSDKQMVYADCQLSAGTVLKVDRVFVRKGGSSEFNSLSFVVVDCSNDNLVSSRFWVTLSDANKMFIKDGEV